MKIVSVVGARPQFIKAAVVSKTLRAKHVEILVHTGQHYDHSMSQVFFDELDLPLPDVDLDVRSGTHGWQTGHMLMRLEEVLLSESPDWVLVYGDTNSTLAGSLAAAKLHIKVAHVEAGLRSFNRAMPEEINRVMTDHVSNLLFCPSQTAVDNLAAEGITQGVHLIGDVMADVLASAKQHLSSRVDLLSRLNITKNEYLIATVHRAENTNDLSRLKSILSAFNSLNDPIVFPVHPRTRKIIDKLDFPLAAHIQLLEPIGYLDMMTLVQSARLVLTDSGGLQKESYWLNKPCITLRDETEWVETVEVGWNILVGANKAQIIETVQDFVPPEEQPTLYGDGHTAERCLSLLEPG